jgi:N-acetylgalactosamine kinase
MVVASALAFLEANQVAYDRIRLAEMLAAAEHYVGTQGGGMDQAICLLGEAGNALKIDFFPLRTLAVPIPDGWSIVICNSLIQAEKTRAALRLYNRRPIECRIAVAMLEKEAGGPTGSIRRLADLCACHTDIRGLLDYTEAFFHEDGYSWDDVVGFLREPPGKTMDRLGKMPDGSLFGEPEDGFRLRKRVRHVLTEAIRVEESVRCLSSGDAMAFGALMNDSHRSCRDDYEISCPELDVLVQTAQAAGAVGSRLTGAGFGGCAVSLVRDDLVDQFSTRVRDEYYERYLAVKRPDLVESVPTDDALFVSKPARGAEVLKRW